MKKHLVIVGFDDIIADKYMDSIEYAILDGHINGYSIIDLFSNQDWIEHGPYPIYCTHSLNVIS